MDNVAELLLWITKIKVNSVVLYANMNTGLIRFLQLFAAFFSAYCLRNSSEIIIRHEIEMKKRDLTVYRRLACHAQNVCLSLR